MLDIIPSHLTFTNSSSSAVRTAEVSTKLALMWVYVSTVSPCLNVDKVMNFYETKLT